MMKLILTFKCANGKRGNLVYPISIEDAEDPVRRADHINARASRISVGKMVNWRIEPA